MALTFHCDEDGTVWYECRRCGARLPIDFPTTFLQWIERKHQFAASHTKCQPRK